MPQDTEARRFITKYLEILDHPLSSTADLQCAVVAHIQALVVLAGHVDRAASINGSGVAAARLRAIKADILENLTDPELTETAVALRQHVTPRYIRMLFKVEGTSFTMFLRDHRLVRAHCMLSDPFFAGMNITAIALAVGFNDLSYFDRIYRQKFYMSPSQARVALLQGA